MSVVIGLLCGLAAWLALPSRPTATGRIRRLGSGQDQQRTGPAGTFAVTTTAPVSGTSGGWPAPGAPAPGRPSGTSRAPALRRLGPPVGGLGLAALVVAVAGPVAAAVVSVAVVLGLARRLRRGAVAGVPSSADAALFTDLLAGCLSGGMTTSGALRLAATAGPDLRDAALTVAAALDGGLPSAEAWQPLAAFTGLAPVAAVCVRSAGAGSAAADELRRIARRLRARHHDDVERRVARAGVWLVLPLGACFLPAFVLLSVVPVVVGLLPTLA